MSKLLKSRSKVFLLCVSVFPMLTMTTVLAQSTLFDTLVHYGSQMILDEDAAIRWGAFERVGTDLVTWANDPGTFDQDIDSARIMSIFDESKTLRILTAQVLLDDGTSRCLGIVRFADGRAPVVLVDVGAASPYDVEPLEGHQWYGALYYNVMATTVLGQPGYLAFGFRVLSELEYQKCVEVFYWHEGQLKQGAPIFVNESGTQSRLSMRYFSSAGVKFNYDQEQELIIHDHLIPMKDHSTGAMVMVPDGSYCAYQYEDGLWYFIDKLPTIEMKEAPRERPVLDGVTRDLFGRKNRR